MVDDKKMKLGLERKVGKLPERVYISDPALKRWDEMTWEDVYAEHRELVPRVTREHEGTSYYYDHNETYTKEFVESIENSCVDGLAKIVDRLRAKHPKDAKPVNCDWYEVFWDYDIRSIIEENIRDNELLKKQAKISTNVTAVNFAIAVADEYNRLVNDRNGATDFSG